MSIRFFPWILVALAVFLSPAAALAGGSWTIQYGPETDGATFRDVALMGPNKLYTVGVKPVGILHEERAWLSRDNGLSWTTTVDATSYDPCSFAYMFNTLNTVDFYTPVSGAVAGGAVPDICQVINPTFPYCELCLALYAPTVWYANQEGTQLQWAFSRGDIFAEFFFVEHLSAEIILAGGSGNTLVASYGTEGHWAELLGPISGDGIYTDTEFQDGQLGFMTTAETSDARLSSQRPATVAEARDRIGALAEVRGWLKDPIFRMERRARSEISPLATATAGCYKTLNAGGSWMTVFQQPNAAALKTSWYNEDYGMVITDEAFGPDGRQFSLYYTHDGGANWYRGAVPDTGPYGAGTFDAADVKYLTSSLAYIVGAHTYGSVTSGFILESADGGRTWNWSDFVPEAALTAFDFFDRYLGFLVGVNSFVAKYVGVNDPPVADAGPDQTVALNAHVYLDGTGSNDPDDLIDSYLWEQLDGPAISLYGWDRDTAYFIASEAGTLRFKLSVTSGGQTRSDNTRVIVSEDVDDDAVDDDITDDDVDDDAVDDDVTDDDIDDDVADDDAADDDADDADDAADDDDNHWQDDAADDADDAEDDDVNGLFGDDEGGSPSSGDTGANGGCCGC